MDPDRAHLVPFNTTNREKELAVRLGIPRTVLIRNYFRWAQKSGGRKFSSKKMFLILGV